MFYAVNKNFLTLSPMVLDLVGLSLILSYNDVLTKSGIPLFTVRILIIFCGVYDRSVEESVQFLSLSSSIKNSEAI